MTHQDLHSISLGLDNEIMLYLQHQHRSTAIWVGNDPRILRIRHHCHMTGWTPHERIIPYIVTVGLYGVASLETIGSDHALITALVERWRQETHTLHLPVGETTVTL